MDTINKKFRLVGGEIELVLYNLDKFNSEHIFDAFYLEALRLQKIFNIFDSKSEINQLNERRRMKVSRELLEVIKLALGYCELTNGEYDISLGKKISARKKGKEVEASCSFRDILINDETVSLENEEGLLDLGSIAKGYIGDELARFLKKQGVEDFFLDLRGDLIISGNHEEKISIQHPRIKEKKVLSFNLQNEAVATSGDYSQFVKNFSYSHIIGAKNFISATVISKSLAEADVIATCLMVVG